MVYSEAQTRLSKDQIMTLWQKRLDSVDLAIENSKTAWSLEFWTNVRKALTRQVWLLDASFRQD